MIAIALNTFWDTTQAKISPTHIGATWTSGQVGCLALFDLAKVEQAHSLRKTPSVKHGPQSLHDHDPLIWHGGAVCHLQSEESPCSLGAKQSIPRGGSFALSGNPRGVSFEWVHQSTQG